MLIARELKALLENEYKFNKFTSTTFKMADTDNSGQINSVELYNILYKISLDIGAEPPSKEDTRDIVIHLDTDRSGKISLKEFKTIIRDILRTMTDDENRLNKWIKIELYYNFLNNNKKWLNIKK